MTSFPNIISAAADELNTNRELVSHWVDGVASSALQEGASAHIASVARAAAMPLIALGEALEIVGKAVLCVPVSVLKSGIRLLGLSSSSDRFSLQMQAWRVVRALALLALFIISTVTIPLVLFKPTLVVRECDILKLRQDTPNTDDITQLFAPPQIVVESAQSETTTDTAPLRHRSLTHHSTVLKVVAGAIAAAAIVGLGCVWPKGNNPAPGKPLKDEQHAIKPNSTELFVNGSMCTTTPKGELCYNGTLNSHNELTEVHKFLNGTLCEKGIFNATEPHELINGTRYHACGHDVEGPIVNGKLHGHINHWITNFLGITHKYLEAHYENGELQLNQPMAATANPFSSGNILIETQAANWMQLKECLNTTSATTSCATTYFYQDRAGNWNPLTGNIKSMIDSEKGCFPDDMSPLYDPAKPKFSLYKTNANGYLEFSHYFDLSDHRFNWLEDVRYYIPEIAALLD